MNRSLGEILDGTIGTPVDLVVNCIKLFFNPDWKLQKYRVHFNPNIQTNIQNEILIKHKSILREFVFYGYHLYTPVKYGLKKFILYDYGGPDGSLVMITINHVGEIQESDLIRVPILKKFLLNCFCYSNCMRVESRYYNPEATVTNTRLGIKYLPGYEFGFSEVEGQLLLRIGLINKIETTETVLDFLRVSCGNSRNRVPSLINNFKASIIGTVILTSHNNKLYKICGVNENLNIYSTFITEDGSKISYMDYYKQKWNITFIDAKQPMLKTTKHDENGTLKTVYLVPELCIITKLTEIIGNKTLVKELNQYTNYGPNKTMIKYKQFFSKLHSKTKFIDTLKTWNLRLGEHFIKTSGRVLPSFFLKSFAEIYPIGPLGNWTREIQFLGMIVIPKVESWVILTPSKYFLKVKKFTGTLRSVANLIAIRLPIPEIIQMNDACQRTYMNHLDDIIKNNVHTLILCVVKSLHSNLSNKINRKLCIGAAVPSQLISLKQVTINDNSKCFKTAIRINCKLGGVPWLLHVPKQNFMAVGLDIYQDLHDKRKYFCAVMASMDDSYTRYFSFLESLRKEYISEFFVTTIGKAMHKFKDKNGIFPKGIFIYRDGLEFDTIINMNSICVSEIILLMKQRDEFFGGAVDYIIPFVYITIQKNYITKLFCQYGPTNYRNPPIGTIVDTSITDEIMYDFLLISHKTKSGIVKPTYYRIVYNCFPNITIDEIHMFTFMLTHMYFNCSHTIRVPAPCRMAYKLAYFCANTLKSTQNILLHGFPFFF
ncbi:piwi-like protein Siwi [Rhopalosiphum padi]|uniref:piwi-like protein Siwi n=1 Tax=Rhopalosiphum padi TaxID=40932 RepID=UPI00298DCC38|nr:piwi-like protein Siwi [Rhopalosiphum padi]